MRPPLEHLGDVDPGGEVDPGEPAGAVAVDRHRKRQFGRVTQPGNIDYAVAIFIIFILVSYVGMVYGPIGAFLAEYFPARIRYTSVSVPYHIGNGWGGGLVPFITTAAFAATGSLWYALLYPILVPAICFVLALFLMPETRHISIWNEPKGEKARA